MSVMSPVKEIPVPDVGPTRWCLIILAMKTIPLQGVSTAPVVSQMKIAPQLIVSVLMNTMDNIVSTKKNSVSSNLRHAHTFAPNPQRVTNVSVLTVSRGKTVISASICAAASSAKTEALAPTRQTATILHVIVRETRAENTAKESNPSVSTTSARTTRDASKSFKPTLTNASARQDMLAFTAIELITDVTLNHADPTVSVKITVSDYTLAFAIKAWFLVVLICKDLVKWKSTSARVTHAIMARVIT